MQPLQGVRDAKSLLLQLFADFPTACLDMIDTTDADVILEGPVLTRAARKMPACMGRGSVVVLGEAAHPVRPSGEWTAIVVQGSDCKHTTTFLQCCSTVGRLVAVIGQVAVQSKPYKKLHRLKRVPLN